MDLDLRLGEVYRRAPAVCADCSSCAAGCPDPRESGEAPITEYEHSRNEEIMKNNQELERLGIKTLVPIVKNTSVERKGKDHEVSGSLYIGQESGQESEDCEDEEVISKRQEKYKDVQPTAIDLFKDFHCSKNKGFSEPIKKAIADMEAIMAEPVHDEEQPKSVNHVVSQVVKSTTFLQVAGIQPNSNNSSKGCTSSKNEHFKGDQ
ncbi:unnamed protein product [Miscanthus lutarioriparius]|uniref:4Fe-4S ferredoxin-type domain-containing protein n=1 Tax=Miscanthus lutarioriparius TaxID=422564 RepID=A0A811QI19_9POAL|nr:unnamed protein product [Miscanthus lutarioriparius]